jgi:hypothetical protein
MRFAILEVADFQGRDASFPPASELDRILLSDVVAGRISLDAEDAEPSPQPRSLADVTRRLFSPMIRYRSCHSVGPLDGDTCTAVTLYSGQLVAQSELSVVTTFT